MISSSVTARLPRVSMRSSFKTAWVVMESKPTKGRAALASQAIGLDTSLATGSGYSWPILLGTSSPKIMVVKVMAATTREVAVKLAADSERPQLMSQSATPPLNAASPTMPFITPIDVMPTCTVDKNCVGFSSNLRAAAAPLSPASSMAASLALRLEARANSDMANTPFTKVKNTISKKSIPPLCQGLKTNEIAALPWA